MLIQSLDMYLIWRDFLNHTLTMQPQFRIFMWMFDPWFRIYPFDMNFVSNRLTMYSELIGFYRKCWSTAWLCTPRLHVNFLWIMYTQVMPVFHRLIDYGSGLGAQRLMAHGSRIVAHGSWLMAHGQKSGARGQDLGGLAEWALSHEPWAISHGPWTINY